MKPSKTLTHTAIAGAQAKVKPYKLTDTDRLYVLVTITGKKYWKWNYRLDGKDKTYAIGTFPDTKLSEARERRNAADKLVQQDIDPAEHDAEKIRQTKADKATTFWPIAEEC